MSNAYPDPSTDPLYIAPETAEKFKGDGRVHSPSAMRSLAQTLGEHLTAMQGAPSSGSVDNFKGEVQVATNQFGEWNDAKVFGSVAGKDSAGTKFEKAYTDFVNAYKNVVAAVEASAGNHKGADDANEGA